ARVMVFVSVSMSGPCFREQYPAARRLEQRNGTAQLVRAAPTGVIQSGLQIVLGKPRRAHERSEPVFRRQARVRGDTAHRRFVERADRGGVQGFAAAEA